VQALGQAFLDDFGKALSTWSQKCGKFDDMVALVSSGRTTSCCDKIVSPEGREILHTYAAFKAYCKPLRQFLEQVEPLFAEHGILAGLLPGELRCKVVENLEIYANLVSAVLENPEDLKHEGLKGIAACVANIVVATSLVRPAGNCFQASPQGSGDRAARRRQASEAII
jgi:hypothetical protein